MSLQDFTSLFEILASIGVIVSLIFVGYQMKQNTNLLERSEHNSTMEQWSTIRMVLIENRDVAELWTAGLNGETEINAADQLRLESLLSEQLWACYHVWERTKRGILKEGTFAQAVAPLIPSWLKTPRGEVWWSSAKLNYPPAFVVDVDAANKNHTSVGLTPTTQAR